MVRHIGLVLFLIMPGLTHAAGKAPDARPLKFKVFPMLPRPRSQAPQTIDVRVSCNSPNAFTGRLELKWYLNRTLVHEYVSNEFTVVEPGTTLRLIVPQVVARAEKTPISIDARFVMDDGVIVFDEETGPTFPPQWKRAFVMVIVQPPEMLLRPSEREAAKNQGLLFKRGLTESLNLEQFNPLTLNQTQVQLDSALDLLTYPFRQTPEQMPTAAVGYAPFDMLLLEGQGFVQLKAKQLEAMYQWVAAGGCVVVYPQGKLSGDHVDFLNRLAGLPGGINQDGQTAGYALDEQGAFVIGESARMPHSKYSLHATGLGRTLIIHEALVTPDDFESLEWIRAVCFLWKMRYSQLDHMTKQGQKMLSAGVTPKCFWEFHQARDQRFALTPLNRPYRPYEDDLPRTIRQFLLPDRIEGVPLAAVASILVAYLLCVAPGDYFLLGRLNCRKYTWSLFVVISAGFTVSTVLIAKNYMGHADYHTSLIVADVIDDKSQPDQTAIARTTRFDMLFVAQPQMVEIPLRNELYTDLTERTVLPDKNDAERSAFMMGNDNVEMDAIELKVSDLPIYSGVVPYSYSVHQQMRQWSPRVNRRTTLGDNRELLAASHIDWSKLQPENWEDEAGRKALIGTILEREPNAAVFLFHNTEIVAIHDPERNFTATSQEHPGLAVSDLGRLINSMSNREPKGLFSVVSQIAPTGGVFLEDLSLMDSSNPRQWLLGVAVKRDNEWIVYRKSVYDAR
jgi:hypothetical protein